jgi:hypothetical protein
MRAGIVGTIALKFFEVLPKEKLSTIHLFFVFTGLLGYRFRSASFAKPTMEQVLVSPDFNCMPVNRKQKSSILPLSRIIIHAFVTSNWILDTHKTIKIQVVEDLRHGEDSALALFEQIIRRISEQEDRELIRSRVVPGLVSGLTVSRTRSTHFPSFQSDSSSSTNSGADLVIPITYDAVGSLIGDTFVISPTRSRGNSPIIPELNFRISDLRPLQPLQPLQPLSDLKRSSLPTLIDTSAPLPSPTHQVPIILEVDFTEFEDTSVEDNALARRRSYAESLAYTERTASPHVHFRRLGSNPFWYFFSHVILKNFFFFFFFFFFSLLALCQIFMHIHWP